VTTGILTSRREKNRLNSLYLSSPTDSNKSMYTNYRNLYNKIVRMAKKLHLDRLFIQYQSNLTKTWQLIHQTINKKPKKNTSIIPFIKVKDKTITDPFDIANEFNEFFASIPINITENILPSDVPPVLPNSNDVPIFKFEDNPLTRSEITDAIKSLKIKKTPDMFGISTFFISKFPLTLSSPLLHVFNLSLMQGIVPQQLKVAKVIPIFKSGEVDCTDNYRPISLLPIFSKILERIVCNRLSTFLDVNNLLSNCQFGFRKEHSTVHPLSQFVNFIAEKLNNKEHALAIFCDIKKAFDCVNHSILIKKLYNLGIRDRELLWFQDYLSNRKQFVYVNGLNSYLTKILIGVPQGSILGPILFLIYINDLPTCTSLYTTLFADDTKLVASNTDLVSLFDYVNIEFQKVVQYFRSNKLFLHPSKTKFILFSNSSLQNLDNLQIFMNNNNVNSHNPDLITPIEQITTDCTIPAVRFLGIYIDPKLNFKYHLSLLNSKLSKALYFLRQAKNNLSFQGLKAVYYSLFHSHLVYCNIIWSSAKNYITNPIYLKQKAAIRIVCNSKFNAHTEPLFKKAKILPLPKLTMFFRLQFFQRFLQGFTPTPLINTWIKNRDRPYTGGSNLRNSNDIFLPVSRLTHFENFPFYCIPKLWLEFNKEDVKIIRDKNEFNFKLKSFLLSELNENYICNRLICPFCTLNNDI